MRDNRLTPGRTWPVSAYQYPLNPSRRGPVYLPPTREPDCPICRVAGLLFILACAGSVFFGLYVLGRYVAAHYQP